ncbi:MAG: 2,3-bisphosphoglycerate-independent phosphoglycerate mutase [Candidatus Aminicenantes bacterium]|nr:2,3-bisphosphoglycerate-independent phosphoglycerate mutase [Candidatus Aminicenantes bacterium]MDH5714528.1 2,3-bisphosphoglycerate-independent phosphoglycerate mutase [Candidatus Aminicenantes bacterium]
MKELTPQMKLLKAQAEKSESRIILLIIDGLGGLPLPENGQTELETAHTPYLDSLVKGGICGMLEPIQPGITPGSGPAHLALFGYDPLHFTVGRGVLEALGIEFPLEESDIVGRMNFASIDKSGRLTDRRAGRISSEKGRELCSLLGQIKKVDGAEVFAIPVSEYRAALVLRGSDLSDKLSDSDPQALGVTPLEVQPLNPEARNTAHMVNEFIARAKEVLSTQHPANMILCRGFGKYSPFPSMKEVYKLRSAAVVTYPMYKGVARLVGMELISTGVKIEEEFNTLRENFHSYDFWFLHIKHPDSAGEDGDFQRKVALIEEVDQLLPSLTELKPDVLVVTGDHSTPCTFKAHSWHTVPIVLSSQWARPDRVEQFNEKECLYGGLGRFPATELMPLALAHALRLKKYGA